jgi:ABC-type branched-subunit amino acid transport system ATPase component
MLQFNIRMRRNMELDEVLAGLNRQDVNFLMLVMEESRQLHFTILPNQ